MDFELPLGIDIPDVSGLKDGFEISGDDSRCMTAVLGADKLGGFIRSFTDAMEGPIFFFLELPCTPDEEKELENTDGGSHYRLYYLDNCTKPVIRAILKAYGSLLINDGLCRFGFGGNESGDEIYVQSYKVMSIYCAGEKLKAETLRLLKKHGAEEQKTLVTPWDILSRENPGTCVRIEEDGISVYDLPEILSDAGMYFCEIRN